MKIPLRFSLALAASCLLFLASDGQADDKHSETVRVFIFAGQSNMVGSDSKVRDIQNFPPFAGLDQPQADVRFSYCIGRENKLQSDGWVPLAPVNNTVGPELSFAKTVSESIDAPIAIIKCAAGGTHLGGDWNPQTPSGFKMYPLALQLVKESLERLRKDGVKFQIEGFMWHQGENDMFNQQYMANYGQNLKAYLARWRVDLNEPNLRFYVGELCTKTIWGMDLRPRMYAISKGQKSVTDNDSMAEYIPTSHVGVEIGGGVGLHYHYGTLGQLEHGVNYAQAYLRSIGKLKQPARKLRRWPYEPNSPVKLFVLAGHRNMEGERAFVEQVPDSDRPLVSDNHAITFRYDLAAGFKKSMDWEPLGPANLYGTFGPELSFARRIVQSNQQPFAIAKFTDSGSQIVDWSPQGSDAKSRHVYPRFIDFIQTSMKQLQERGHTVQLAGVFYHMGENDMSFFPFRKKSGEHIANMIRQSRIDLDLPNLDWYISQQPPTDTKDVNRFDPVAPIGQIADNDTHVTHIKAFDLPPQAKQLVIDAVGVIALGETMADAYQVKVAKEN